MNQREEQNVGVTFDATVVQMCLMMRVRLFSTSLNSLPRYMYMDVDFTMIIMTCTCTLASSPVSPVFGVRLHVHLYSIHIYCDIIILYDIVHNSVCTSTV